MKKRVLSLFLIVILLIGFVPMIISDEEGGDSGDGGGDSGSGEPSGDSGGGDIEGGGEGGPNGDDFGGEIGGGRGEGFEGDMGPHEGFEGEGPREFEEILEPDQEQINEFVKNNNMEDLVNNNNNNQGESGITEEGEFYSIQNPPDNWGGCSDEQVECPKDSRTEWIVQNGCNVGVCITELEGDLGEVETCSIRGGEMVGDRCVTPLNEIRPIGELKPISEEAMSEINRRLDEFKSKLNEFLGKLEGKEGEEFEDARTRLRNVMGDIESIQTELAGEITDEERRDIISRLDDLGKTAQQVLIGIKQGRRVDEKFLRERKMEQFGQFGEFTREDLERMIQKEEEARGYVRNCDMYSEDEPKEFVPPDPSGEVVNVKLSGLAADGRCMMEITFNDGKIANYGVFDFRSFNPEKSFSKQDVTCSGACDKMEEMRERHRPQDEGGRCMDNCINRDCDEGFAACMLKNEQKCAEECDMGPPEDMEGEFGPTGPEGDFGGGPGMGPPDGDYPSRPGDFGPPEGGEFGPPTGFAVSESDGEGIITKFFNWLKGLFSFGEDEGVKISEGDTEEDITSDLLRLSDELDDISEDLS